MEVKYVLCCLDNIHFIVLTFDLQRIRLTVRATDDSVPAILLKLMQDHLSMGVFAGSALPEPPTRQEISDAFGNVMVA